MTIKNKPGFTSCYILLLQQERPKLSATARLLGQRAKDPKPAVPWPSLVLEP